MASRSPTCRCGTTLTIPPGIDKLICPVCGARVRVRREAGSSASMTIPSASAWPGGVILFHCPCGQKLKFEAANAPKAGRCPSCRRIVPVPELPDDAPTGEMPAADRTVLDNWIAQHAPDGLMEEDSDNAANPRASSPASTALAASPFGPQRPRSSDGSLEMMIDPDLMGTLADRLPALPDPEAPPASAEDLNESPGVAPPLVPPRPTVSQARTEFSQTRIDLNLEALDNAAARVPPPSSRGFGGGLRVCGHCQRPLHIVATVCRHCGTAVAQS